MIRYLLNTDIVSILFRSELPPQPLIERLSNTPAEEIAVSIVSVEEFMQGALALIRREDSQQRGVEGYRLLHRLINELSSYQVVPFEEDDRQIYDAFPKAVRRLGSNDCRIAATALRHQLMVVTRNQRHFGQIPGCIIEDWTQS
jgi:tRNA(fMet)-specific endonuclease VapC